MFSGVKKSAETSEIMEVPPDHPFYFDCRAEVPCFNHCCRDLNQVLTPYDVARLRHHLGMSSTAFLDRFTRRQMAPPPRAADDLAWLSLGMAFVRQEIFGETPEVGHGFK